MILLMCLSYLRVDCKVTPMYFVESVLFFEGVAMKFVGKLDRFLFRTLHLSAWKHNHEPILFQHFISFHFIFTASIGEPHYYM